MTIDERINALLAPIADWLGKVVFFSIPVGEAQLPLIVAWLIMGGVVCTIAFRFVNLRGFRHSARVIRGDYSDRQYPGEATPFQALSTAVSGTVGLGSIGGVAVAVTLGGPGAALWMMVAGFLGMSLKFAEVTLAVKYRRVRADGTVTGGAMYYVPEALGRVGMPRLGKLLAGFFCVAAIGGSVTIFQVSQAYSQVREVTGFDQAFLFGVMVAVWIGIVLFGGVRRIVYWTDKLSPIMCVVYIVACLVVLGANYANILPALGTIVREAFVPDAVAGGIVGALIQGFRRAAFANEAGVGSAPMAHATVRTQEPMSQGFAALMEPFLDTIIICLLTALVIVVSGVNDTSTNVGIALTSDAFATVVPWFPAVLAVVAVLFALSTVLAWGYYGEQAWMWLFSERKASRVAFRLFLCSMLSIAATFPLDQVVNIVDACSFCMAVPNILAIYLLMPELRADLAGYWQRVVLKGAPEHKNVA
ncbi:MAG TPA: amino acid carrier protein [Steroidobacteraceae bacterium]|nr:amino acid carrier protein [Steroidobacteraceae bacterium]